MDFTLSETQKQYVKEARLVAEMIAPGYKQREIDRGIDPGLRREIGARGLIAPELPVDLGGRGEPRLTSGLITEEIARGDFNVAYLQVVGSLVGQILVRSATPAVAATWVPRIASGEDIVAIGLSEPGAGSDAGNPSLTARRGRGGWVLNGTKSMSFAQQCGAAVVFAKTDPDAGRGRGISAFLVDRSGDGLQVEGVSDMGTRAVTRGFVHFTDAWIPEENLVGPEGAGFTQVMQGFDFSRALIGLQCIGAAAVTVEETWAHVSARQAFDQPLSKFQGVSFPLAESETLLTAARLLCHQTLWLKDEGLPHTAQAAMSKWWAPKTAYDVINSCLLLHGQFGYMTDNPIEQRMRDVLGLQIGDGTAQIMKLIIARQSVGREFAP
ncbi:MULTISPECIES: acyl-CoA dehydrogenase family protein [unclassified Arthrobacter]|uniref:acyl-CoA dehydrogenase family protein n=1 Tax=unclassified Arthrobacter TaxID=235627 RepID=UPI00159EB168|nr:MULTISPECIES: acyl-CoA dehydrogenase family protein [unclassified Arthrobacter]MCQ9165331.1 acyl-CoA dehydrogenase family protein [Arthrobacter sp. STN4]NVN00128.1 cyclohexanecarboxyl-CoA dehydrogenase [Arthrobacter sp. SDTb3-6]